METPFWRIPCPLAVFVPAHRVSAQIRDTPLKRCSGHRRGACGPQGIGACTRSTSVEGNRYGYAQPAEAQRAGS